MATNYTRWYRDGTVALTKNSAEVTGTSTYWGSANLNPGDIFVIDNTPYEIASVTDNTHLTLVTPYTGDTVTGKGYAIIRNFTATTQAKNAAQTAELLGDFARFIDNEHKTIMGKSAYEVAKDNGFVGTESEWLESLTAYGQAKLNGYTGTLAQWLESLKAAGEWANADSRLKTLESVNSEYQSYFRPELYAPYQGEETLNGYNSTYNPAVRLMHRQIYRGQNLGTKPTAEQLKAIRTGNLEDIYLGDYWETEMDITYPLLNEADSANGDTYTNDQQARTLKGPVQWVIVDIDYYHAESVRNLVIMPCTLNAAYTTETGGGWYHPGAAAAPMNYKPTADCGYFYSLPHQKIFPALLQALQSAWSGSNFSAVNDLLTVSGSNALLFRFGHSLAKMLLPTYKQIFGSSVYSGVFRRVRARGGRVSGDSTSVSDALKTVDYERLAATEASQFAAFQVHPRMIKRMGFNDMWLREMMSTDIADSFIQSTPEGELMPGSATTQRSLFPYAVLA